MDVAWSDRGLAGRDWHPDIASKEEESSGTCTARIDGGGLNGEGLKRGVKCPDPGVTTETCLATAKLEVRGLALVSLLTL